MLSMRMRIHRLAREVKLLLNVEHIIIMMVQMLKQVT